MQIQINTDRNIDGNETMAGEVTRVVANPMLEARLEGRQPIAVTHNAATITQAVHGAADKLTRVFESTLGRVAHTNGSRA